MLSLVKFSVKAMFKNRRRQNRQCTYNVILARVRVTTVAVEKQLSITYSECVSVALVTQHAKRTHRIILSSVACPAVPYYLINGMIFGGGGGIIEHKTSVFDFLYNFCPKDFSF
jgi:hypothetical protein